MSRAFSRAVMAYWLWRYRVRPTSRGVEIIDLLGGLNLGTLAWFAVGLALVVAMELLDLRWFVAVPIVFAWSWASQWLDGPKRS